MSESKPRYYGTRYFVPEWMKIRYHPLGPCEIRNRPDKTAKGMSKTHALHKRNRLNSLKGDKGKWESSGVSTTALSYMVHGRNAFNNCHLVRAFIRTTREPCHCCGATANGKPRLTADAREKFRKLKDKGFRSAPRPLP